MRWKSLAAGPEVSAKRDDDEAEVVTWFVSLGSQRYGFAFRLTTETLTGDLGGDRQVRVTKIPDAERRESLSGDEFRTVPARGGMKFSEGRLFSSFRNTIAVALARNRPFASQSAL